MKLLWRLREDFLFNYEPTNSDMKIGVTNYLEYVEHRIKSLSERQQIPTTTKRPRSQKS